MNTFFAMLSICSAVAGIVCMFINPFAGIFLILLAIWANNQ